jgi:hypothetical protein
MQFLDTLPERRVTANADYNTLVEALGGPVPEREHTTAGSS